MTEQHVIAIKFAGFRRSTHAGNIHASMGMTARTTAAIIEETGAPKRLVLKHLRYWEKRGAYVETAAGWIFNRKGVRFEPKEWAGE